MSIADYVILGTILLSMLLSVKRGFTIEAISLFNWLAAFTIARLFSTQFSILLTDLVDIPSLRQPIAFAILFVATLIVGALIRHLIKLLVKATGLSGIDRMLGTVFGFVRGVILVLVVLIVTSRLGPVSDSPVWRNSLLIPHFLVIEHWSATVGMSLWAKFMTLGGK